MQPYFFPYLGYFSLIKSTNRWIVFDIPQYEKGSWINRNRVIDSHSNSWKFITIPVKKHNLNTPINKIQIQNNISWKEKLILKLDHYKRFAPNYKIVADFLNEILSVDFDSLSKLNIHTLISTCEYLGIEFNFEIFSEVNYEIEPVHKPDEWALNICKSLGVTKYINAERGQTFIDRQKYVDNNIDLQFLAFAYPEYCQKTKKFIPGLSVIDAMMFNSPAEINDMLNEYRLIK